MKDQRRRAVSTGFVVLLCGLLVGVAAPAVASKSSSKKCDVTPGARMTAAAVPKTPAVGFSQVRTRRPHGINSLRQTNARRAIGRGLTHLNNSRATLGQREQTLDSSRIHVIDGDTFAYGSERIRIQGFNAAERSDPGGFEATRRLEMLLHQGQVTMIPKATDIYGRIVAQIFVDRLNVIDLLNLQ
ncbi:thermonuclease family protein [Nitrospira sp. Nam74]